jgi:hypothetical protein
MPNTSGLRGTREGAGSCLHATIESEANAPSVEPGLKNLCQPVNERPQRSYDHIRPYNNVYAKQLENEQIVDVALVNFQPLNNTRSRDQQYNNLVCDDQHTETSFESTSREQPHQVQDVGLPADETP